MFKHFAQFSTSSETWATRATWATETPKPRKPAAFEPDCPVTQNENVWATVGNQEREVAQVALVTHVSDEVENWAKCLNTLASVAHDLGAQVVAALRAHAGQLVC